VATPSSFKSRVRQRLSRAPLRYLARPLFDALVGVELAVLRGLGRTEPPNRQALARVTAIIKTFERPKLLQRLLDSLALQFPGLNVIVADDSREPRSWPGVRTIPLPFDSGVSAGRQAALEAVQTELTWVLDDDFVVFAGTRLDEVLCALADYPELDLVGGSVLDLPLFSRRGSPRDLVYPTPRAPRLPLGTRLGRVEICDKVPNFFVARTRKLLEVGWDARLKRVEHGDFFTRARGVLVSGFLPRFCCLHAQAPFDLDYMRHRDDHAADEAVLRARHFPDD
jgi:hypothetical protein